MHAAFQSNPSLFGSLWQYYAKSTNNESPQYKSNVTGKLIHVLKWLSEPHHEDVLGSEGITPPFLTLALYGDGWPVSRPGPLSPGETEPGARYVRGWMCRCGGLNAVENRKKSLAPDENRNPFRRSSSPEVNRYTDWAISNGEIFHLGFGHRTSVNAVPRDAKFQSPIANWETNKLSRNFVTINYTKFQEISGIYMSFNRRHYMCVRFLCACVVSFPLHRSTLHTLIYAAVLCCK
jgi:hypothetical protein